MPSFSPLFVTHWHFCLMIAKALPALVIIIAPRQPLPAVSAALPSLLLVTRPLEAPPSRARSDLGCKGARGTRAGPTTKSTEMPMAGGWRQGAEVEMKLTPKRAGSGGGRGKKIGPGGGGKSRSEAPSFASSS